MMQKASKGCCNKTKILSLSFVSELILLKFEKLQRLIKIPNIPYPTLPYTAFQNYIYANLASKLALLQANV